MDRLRSSDRPGDRWARDPAYVARLLEEVQAKGFGLRDPDFGGDYDAGRASVDDKRDSLGVAIRLGNYVAGALNVTWSKR
ncbi:MAG: transcriptional regulator, partial [Planctomycetales bacterium]|nr:transcriptional regulator [Planctomycetales bacterium]NIM07789.1 transcriptional regulator [Planctomycetales bacterium]NIN07935.1 transcriptional regulator [Planctomycetales bacterium]NIN76375.1 transcriptional regulator [Planctomycetales bacterium]NIP04113.1 transcriptional regulator [Planctomycetales bacterium]